MIRQVRPMAGASLVEVICAALILSAGFLSAALMQANSLRTNQDSYFRAQAGVFLEDMVDRMRANPEGLTAGLYENADTHSTGTAVDCISTACTPAQLVNADIQRWKAQLEPQDGTLPALPDQKDGSPARAVIEMADGLYSVSVSWMIFEDGRTVDTTLTTTFRP